MEPTVTENKYKSLNGQELHSKFIQVLKDLEVSTSEFCKKNISPADYEVLVKEVGPYELVMDQRSDDGDYDSWEKVYHFTDHNVYLMVVGSYHSEYGINFDYPEFSLVEPYEYTVKSFRSVK